MTDAPCDVCAGRIRQPASESAGPAPCAELACFLSEWLYDDTITYAEAWRRWRAMCANTVQPQALAQGMDLAAQNGQPISVFCSKSND